MPFESTAIRDIRYEDDRQKLFVTFVNGGAYVYVGVPGEVHRSFVEAESQGRFFVAEIRDRFPYNRLDS
ncbi:MAG: KTSC domain-containing protein [Caulobacter sp.]|nr:KTSC domain-containing protein [Caulobacter sp.]